MDFDVMTSEIRLGGQIIKQAQYAAIDKGYALMFAISFTNDEENYTEWDIRVSTISTMKFSKKKLTQMLYLRTKL